MKVYIIQWEYPDKSGHGIVRVYTDEVRAAGDYQLLKEQESVRTYTIDAYEVWGVEA